MLKDHRMICIFILVNLYHPQWLKVYVNIDFNSSTSTIFFFDIKNCFLSKKIRVSKKIVHHLASELRMQFIAYTSLLTFQT